MARTATRLSMSGLRRQALLLVALRCRARRGPADAGLGTTGGERSSFIHRARSRSGAHRRGPGPHGGRLRHPEPEGSLGTLPMGERAAHPDARQRHRERPPVQARGPGLGGGDRRDRTSAARPALSLRRADPPGGLPGRRRRHRGGDARQPGRSSRASVPPGPAEKIRAASGCANTTSSAPERRWASAIPTASIAPATSCWCRTTVCSAAGPQRP